MNPLVSIVIPVYNIERYVGRCLTSVMAQTWTNLECIIVNDCSTDGSMDAVLALVNSYQGGISFRIVHHEKNRGLSAARNTGTTKARGEYLLYLDGDDMLMPDSISLLMGPLHDCPLDFVIGDYSVSVPDGSKNDYLALTLDSGIVTDRDAIQTSYYHSWYVMAWNKLIRRNFLVENGIRFKEGAIHEDDIWSFEVACLARSMGVVRENTYFYNIRPSSLNTTDGAHRHARMYSVLQECEAFAASAGMEDHPFVIKTLLHYEGIIFSLLKQQGSFRERYAFYRDHLHSRKFRQSWYASMGWNTRLRYVHRLLPSVAGYGYLSLASLISPLAFNALRLFSKKRP